MNTAGNTLTMEAGKTFPEGCRERLGADEWKGVKEGHERETGECGGREDTDGREGGRERGSEGGQTFSRISRRALSFCALWSAIILSIAAIFFFTVAFLKKPRKEREVEVEETNSQKNAAHS